MTPRLLAFLLAVGGVLALGGCAATRTYVAQDHRQEAPEPPATDVAYEVFLVGNTADGAPEALAPALAALGGELRRAGEQSAVVFLGDVTEAGLPEATSADWAPAEARLRALAETVDGYPGRVFVLPGDRDWAQGEEGVERLEDYLEARLDRGDVVAPGDARSGPLLLEIADGLKLLALDTAWWLSDDAKPTGDAARFDGDEGEYEVENEFEVVAAVEDALRDFDPDEENVLVVGHHPLMSNGPYGGHATLSQHLLPPVLGSVVPLYRQFIGGPQDLASPSYRALRQALGELFLARDAVVYAAAHDRSLQVFPITESIRRTQHYLVSGSIGEGGPVVTGRGAAFASSDRGFMRLRYHESGALWLDVFSFDEDAGTAAVTFTTRLRQGLAENVDPDVPPLNPEALPSYADSTVTRAVDTTYAAGPAKRFLLGTGYREAWTTPVEFPVLDLTGLRPVKRGGGMQTVSLRLIDEDEQEYAVRLLQKVAGRTLPQELRRSVIADIIQDLTSGTNPWGALAAAELAEATGLYHTNPRIVYVPDDPRLGTYREEFADRVALFEEFPKNDMTAFPSFGRSEDVVSAEKLVEEIEGDNDHLVDQPFFLRNRLMDWLLSDWDRHPGQWRWSSFEPFELDPSLEGDARTKGKIYRPIPRDRDFAFYDINGVIPFAARQFMPKLQTFGESYGNLAGLTTSGIPLDRRHTNRLTREDWLTVARDFQADLTDEEIEAAVRLWPDEIYGLYGERTIRLLKHRRDRIVDVAGEVYDLYAPVVDVIGSDRRERFEATRLAGGDVEVVVYDSNEEGDRNEVLYRRTIRAGETGEIRLYGLDGGDFFYVQGDGPARIRIRIIGGAGEDTFANTARGGDVFYHDTESGNAIAERGRTRVVLSDRPLNNRYDPLDFKHGFNAVLLLPGYNRTDGVVLGAGYTINRPGFRRYPWAASHTLSGSYATQTSGVRGHYSGRFYDVMGPDWDATLDLAATTPRYVRNFYGFGNETFPDADEPSDFFHVDVLTAEAELSLIRRIEDFVQGRFGASVAYFDVAEGDADDPRFVDAAGLPAEAFEGQLYARPFVELTLQSVDNEVNPRQGFRWTGRAALHAGLNEPAETFGDLASALAFYVSPSLAPQFTLTARVGGGHNVGDFPFFAAQTIGGEENVRGLVRQRYSGRTALYQNVEARLELFEAFASFVPATVGVLGFADNGRVWADDGLVDGEDDDAFLSGWHQGFGGGLWFSVLDRFVLAGTAASGDDGVLVNVRLRFLY